MKNTTNQELIKIPQSVLNQIKKTIDKHITDNIRKNGFDEIAVYFATTFISINQLRKIASFYNTFTPSDAKENQERKQIYDEANLLPFVDGTLNHLKRLQQSKVATTTNGSQTGREVDRISTSKTLASVRPPKIDPNPTAIQEAQNKFNLLSNYDTSEGLQMKRFRVIYQVENQLIQTTLSLYSASELQSVSKLKQTNTRFNNKNIVILSIEPIK